MISNSNSDFLPPVIDNEFLPPIGSWASLGGVVTIGILFVSITVASVAKYKVTVKAQAIVRPAGELRIVQAATEGQVMHISIKENQVVKKGMEIATIDGSRLQTKKSQIQSNIQQSHLQIVQINAQIDAINRQVAAETDRSKQAVASAIAQLSHRSRDYSDKQITSNTDVEEAQAELQKAQAQLKSTHANFKSTEAALKGAKLKRDRYEIVAKVGALSLNQLEEVQLIVDQQEQAVKMQIAAIEEQLQAIKAARAKWQRTHTGLNPSQAEVAIAQQSIAQEQAKGIATLATLEKERLALIQQRVEKSQQLERDERELQQVEIDLSQTTIAATSDGIISKLNLRNPGQTVRSGEEIAQIVPSDAPLVVKAAVEPQEKSKLKQGQKVLLRVSSCPYTDYGTLKGVVSQISEDTIKPQANNATATAATPSSQLGGAAGTFYEVTIQPEVLSLGKGKNQCHIQVGMEGRADIISREETVLQFFLRKARLIADL